MNAQISPLKMALEFDLGPISQIPIGEGREFIVIEEKIAIFHLHGLQGSHIYATQAECPHEKASLAEGLTGGNVLTCAHHAWKFDLRTGLPLMGDCSIRVYPVRINRAGHIILLL